MNIKPGDIVKVRGISTYEGNRWINLIRTIIGQDAEVIEVRADGIAVNMVSDGKGYFLSHSDYTR